MISEAAISDLKAHNPCDQVAARWVTLRRKGKKMIGPCPLHSPNPHARDSTSFECDADGWVCATCQDGGDVVKLLMKREGIDFPAAIEQLGGVSEPSAERASEIEREQKAKREKAERDEEIHRERRRSIAFEIWKRGEPLQGTAAETYLRERRGIAELPDGLKLRFVPSLAFCEGEEIDEAGRKVARVIHRGPAMLAPIVEPATGKFRGVHRTYIDLAQPNGKAHIIDPATGLAPKGKKSLGSVGGNVIRLHHMAAQPQTLFIGEGIETVLSVWYAMHARDRLSVITAAFWSAIDMGNMAGSSAASVPHPTLKDAGGRTRRVPGPEPELTAPGIAIPDSIVDVILLGDGDSDRFTTQCALCRATKRFLLNSEAMTKIGRSVRTAWAPDGMDFNDLLRAAA